jgi:xanthosine utilization system XapX-like protein
MKRFRYLRLTLGIISMVLGIVFSFIPVIPVLGVLGIFVGAFLLAPYISVFARVKEWVKYRDRSGKTHQAEEKLEEAERKGIKKQKQKERR